MDGFRPTPSHYPPEGDIPDTSLLNVGDMDMANTTRKKHFLHTNEFSPLTNKTVVPWNNTSDKSPHMM